MLPVRPDWGAGDVFQSVGLSYHQHMTPDRGQTPGPPQKTYMKQLDGLRAFAVVFTMITHYTLLQGSLMGYIPFGQMGVRLFFVLSGFLITGILLRTRAEDQLGAALRIFYCRRFLRIFPVYYVTLLVTALVNIRPVRQTFFWHLAYLSNFYFAWRVPPASPVTHFWSLAVEEQFYLIWPGLMLFLPRRHLLKVIIAAVFIGPLTRFIGLLIHFDPAGIGPFSFFDTLGMGAILAYLWDRDLGNPVAALAFSRIALWIGLPAYTVLMVAQNMAPNSIGVNVWYDFALAFLFVWLVSRAAYSFSGPVGALLEWKPINYLGKISYGVYVLHAFMPVVLFYGLRWTHLSIDNQLARFLVLSAMSIAAAAVSWHFLERPINNLKRYFEYDQARKTAAPAVAGRATAV
jgi:peptidoglycan/LPS O-acetylase OafA/YrhL